MPDIFMHPVCFAGFNINESASYCHSDCPMLLVHLGPAATDHDLTTAVEAGGGLVAHDVGGAPRRQTATTKLGSSKAIYTRGHGMESVSPVHVRLICVFRGSALWTCRGKQVNPSPKDKNKK